MLAGNPPWHRYRPARFANLTGCVGPRFALILPTVKIPMKREHWWRWWILFVLALVAIGPSTATAQAGSESTANKLERIRQRMEKGQALYLGGNFAAAAKLFEEGYKASPYSAFLFNAGVCYQKLNDFEHALRQFREYLRVDPQAPDVKKVRKRIKALEAAYAEQKQVQGAAGAAGAPGTSHKAPPPIVPDDQAAMKSLVVIETEPPGAPFKLYVREQSAAQPFQEGGKNPGWRVIASRIAPANLTLNIGRYHIVVEKFRDFNVSETDVDVSPGHVHHFKANLSQGAFMSFLRVSTKGLDPAGGPAKNLEDAYVFLDDLEQKRAPWGRTPHGELLAPGEHSVIVEAPGFEPLKQTLALVAGEQKELTVSLSRVQYGFLRIDSNATQIQVLLDEKPAGVWKSGEAALEVRMSSGKHRLKVLAEGRKTFEGDITVPRGQVLPLHVDMKAKWPRGAAWTQAIIGAAVIGAGVYLGTESDRLYDELASDRKRGVLEADDSRVTKGRWFAVGADAAFAVGGVLGVLATYNFIKDPVPPSGYKEGKPLEFADPRDVRQSARLSSMSPAARALLQPRDEEDSTWVSNVSVGAQVSPAGGGLLLKGTF